MSDECRGDCRVMTAVSNDPEMGNVEMTFREALEMYVSRTHNLEAALAAERKRVAELEATIREIKDAAKCDEYDALIAQLRGVAELEADRERLEWWIRNVVNRGMNAQMYLHRSLKPLNLVQLDPKPVKYRAIQMQLLQGECLGVCGV